MLTAPLSFINKLPVARSAIYKSLHILLFFFYCIITPIKINSSNELINLILVIEKYPFVIKINKYKQ
jgi:hypothetical protein